MFINKLKLENFRSFKELEVDFSSDKKKNRRRTLILGVNGTGKSNILKSIALVTAGSSALGELLGDSNDWIRYGEEHCKIDLWMTTQKGLLRHIWLEIHRGDTLKDVMSRSAESLDEIDDALHYTDRNYFVVGYGASRIMATSSKGRNFSSSGTFYDSPRSQCVATLLNRNASLNSLEDWAIDLDYRKNKSGQEVIRNVFDKFLDGINFHEIDKETRQLMLKTPDGIIPLDALSDGYQNMAGWLGDLLFRINDIFSDRKEPLKTFGVLILDEIDLHLHPAWQRKLLTFIEKTLPNMQLIASTHSPFTAQQAGEGELFIIKRARKLLKIEPFGGNPQELLLHQIIMSDVFGFQTDESVHIEKMKKEYIRLNKTKTKSTANLKKLEKIKEKLNDVPRASYSNSMISEEERNMMRSILKSYNKK